MYTFFWAYGLVMYLPNPSTMSRRQHMVNFEVEYVWLEFQVFLLLDYIRVLAIEE